jgi:hypothetical protein
LNVFIFELPLVDRFIPSLLFHLYDRARHTEIGALRLRGRRCFGPTLCSALGRSAFHQILAGRRSCDVYNILIITSLFNTAQASSQKANNPSAGEKPLLQSGANEEARDRYSMNNECNLKKDEDALF